MLNYFFLLYIVLISFFFFFSSRRRHTRSYGDWSSDVCSSDLRDGEAGQIYNVGGGEELENIDVTHRILRLTGADDSLITYVEDRPGHDRRYSLDTSKLRGLGWSPRRAFETGLRETVEWYRERRDWWEPL